MKYNVNFFFLLIFMMNACVTGHLTRTPNGYHISQNEKFKLRDQFRLSDTTVLSTSHIYRQSCFDVSFLKFYSDGRVIFGRPSQKEGSSSIDTTYDLAGFYKLDGQVIITELSYGFTGNDWTILVSSGKILGDTIVFYKDQVKWKGKNRRRLSNLRGPTGEKCYFIKSFKEENLLKPDW